MNTFLWVLQSLVAVAFFVLGLLKLIYNEDELVAKGLTGLKRISLPLILFIGVSEVMGAIGIIIPMLLDILPVLTVVSAIGFAIIMIVAAFISYKNHDYNKMVPIAIIFLICAFIVYGRLFLNSEYDTFFKINPNHYAVLNKALINT